MCNASFESVIKNECDEQVGPATVNDSTNSTNSEGLGVAKFQNIRGNIKEATSLELKLK